MLPVFARVVGLLGGLCWVVSAVLDELDGGTAAIDAAHWGGLALIAISLVGLGAELVDAMWLRAIVAICASLLVWSVLEVLRGGLPDRWVVGGFGLLLAAYCTVGLLRRRARRPRRTHGSHAK